MWEGRTGEQTLKRLHHHQTVLWVMMVWGGWGGCESVRGKGARSGTYLAVNQSQESISNQKSLLWAQVLHKERPITSSLSHTVTSSHLHIPVGRSRQGGGPSALQHRVCAGREPRLLPHQTTFCPHSTLSVSEEKGGYHEMSIVSGVSNSWQPAHS